MTAIPDRLHKAKAAASDRKKRETAIHRIIDEYQQGRGATACMDEIKRILGRKGKGRARRENGEQNSKTEKQKRKAQDGERGAGTERQGLSVWSTS